MAQEKERKILIGVDGSDQALEAVRYIGRMFFRGRAARAVLYHVFKAAPDGYGDDEAGDGSRDLETVLETWEKYHDARVREFMAKARSTLLDAGWPEEAIGIRVEPRLNGIARDLVEESDKGYQSVVVGSMGVSRLKDLVLGSTAGKLLGHLAGTPLCVVAGSPEPRGVLVAMDASEGARRALEFLPELLRGAPFDVELFHAVRPVKFPADLPDPSMNLARAEQDLLDENTRIMDRVLREAKDHLVRSGLDEGRITRRIVAEDQSRAWAIILEAQRAGCGTIVMGRRGLSKVEDFFIGRVSGKVVNLAKNRAVWVVV
ncbi:MAG: universal stress protein [Proteobacteria bacterium]|nr:universal stress protein [Pseudomonadota bacterium]